MTFPASRCTVVALGGNAVNPPDISRRFDAERQAVRRAVAELALLARTGDRLLVVHGNGPQVGRLLARPAYGSPQDLDVHVAQTQGELGYLVAAAIDAEIPGSACTAVVTRVEVDTRDPAFASPTKPVGPVLRRRPAQTPAARSPDGKGWRRVVPSPRPLAVIEEDAIRALLSKRHVVAGGGGGVAVSRRGDTWVPESAVVDKDYVAALLAVRLRARRLVFVTDVPHAYDRFAQSGATPIARMTAAQARDRLAAGVFAPGSMAPKVKSAVEYVVARDRPAWITSIGGIDAALRGNAGTVIVP